MNKKNKILFSLIIFSFFISAVSVFSLLVTDGSSKEVEKSAGILLGCMFWIGTILGYVFKFLLVYINKNHGNVLAKEKWGLFKVFSNKPGKINDIILMLSTIILFASIVIEINNWIAIIGLFFFILSLELHFVFTGRCYRYFKSIE